MTVLTETTAYTRTDDIPVPPRASPKWDVFDERTEGTVFLLDSLLVTWLYRATHETSGSPFGHAFDLAMSGEATVASISGWVEQAAQLSSAYFARLAELVLEQSSAFARAESARFVARIASPLPRHEGARYRAVLEEDEDGGFVATIPALRGCIAEGEDVAETLAHLKDALRGWMDVAENRGLEIPSPSQFR